MVAKNEDDGTMNYSSLSGAAFLPTAASKIAALILLTMVATLFFQDVMIVNTFRMSMEVVVPADLVGRWSSGNSEDNETHARSEDGCFRVPLWGWPPSKDTNVSLYVRPSENTTLIQPPGLTAFLLEDLLVSQQGPNNSMQSVTLANGPRPRRSRIIIMCHSSAADEGFIRRMSIRKTWKTLIDEDARLRSSIVLVFLLGVPQQSEHPPADDAGGAQGRIRQESLDHGDILQEDFGDSYNNLTLKSMFMLKYMVHNVLDKMPSGGAGTGPMDDNSIFLLKVDDDCFVSPRGLLDYSRIMHRYPYLIAGAALGPGNKVGRPGLLCPHNSSSSLDAVEQKLSNVRMWIVPEYLYPEETFPNALSGSGYFMGLAVIRCLFEKGLETPFVNLEDVFITGLVAAQCPKVALRNSPKFHFMGTHLCNFKRRDILVHKINSESLMDEFLDTLTGATQCRMQRYNSTISRAIITRNVAAGPSKFSQRSH